MSWTFLREFVKAPGEVGALWPSSPALAREIVTAAGVSSAQAVLEIGPGTGVFTREIVRQLAPGARCLAVERNPGLAAEVRRAVPGVEIVEGCATRLVDYWRESGWQAPGAVVSGLPWATFCGDLQDSILGQVIAVSDENTVFTTFAYFGPHWLPRGRAFRRRLRESFRDVRLSRVLLANFPPAFVYRCTR